jgi:putative phosphoesterase
MRIGILSDTHDQQARTARAVAILADAGAEALIHCGDLTRPDMVHLCGILPAYFVFGNNDDDLRGLRAAIDAVGGTCLGYGGEIALGGKRIAVTHGDNVREIRRLASAIPDYLLFGHTHLPSAVQIGATRHINPGALHRASSWTVALLDLARGELKSITVR